MVPGSLLQHNFGIFRDHVTNKLTTWRFDDATWYIFESTFSLIWKRMNSEMALIQTYATCLDTFTETETEKRSEKWKFSFSQKLFFEIKIFKSAKESDWLWLVYSRTGRKMTGNEVDHEIIQIRHFDLDSFSGIQVPNDATTVIAIIISLKEKQNWKFWNFLSFSKLTFELVTSSHFIWLIRICRSCPFKLIV